MGAAGPVSHLQEKSIGVRMISSPFIQPSFSAPAAAGWDKSVPVNILYHFIHVLSLMQGMSNISETQGQGCFGGGHHQMRITHGNMSTASTQHSALTEIHEKDDVHYNIDDENHIDFMSKHISTGVVAAGAPPLLLGIYDEETRLSVPHSPAVDSVTLDTRSEAGEDLAKSLGSQTLDLDTLLSPSAALMLPVHMSPVAAATSQSDEVARGSLISCSQAAEMARQAKAESMVG